MMFLTVLLDIAMKSSRPFSGVLAPIPVNSSIDLFVSMRVLDENFFRKGKCLDCNIHNIYVLKTKFY